MTLHNPDIAQKSRQQTVGGLAHTGLDFFLLALAIAAPVLSWLYSQYTSESHWFARSGSVMVVIGIILESRLYIVRQILFQSHGDSTGRGTTLRHAGMRKLESVLTHLVLISGTIVWGYGDLIFYQFRLAVPNY